VFCPIRQQSNKRVPRSLRFCQGAGACNARCGRTLGKINASNRLIDLECAQLSGLRVNMAPVAKAKRHVAILLNLEYHDVAAQRVNRASRQENGIAGLRSEPYKVVCHRPVCDRSPKTGCSDARLQARIDAAFCRGFQHDPCFGLRGLARRHQVRILFPGMHLDREHFMCIEEFQQQWKSAETPGRLSQKLFRKLFQQLSDSPSFEWSVGHLARMVVAVAEYPRLADRPARQRCRKQGGQMPTAPEPILIDRFESQGIQRYLINGISP
jgi:hypothetical protein